MPNFFVATWNGLFAPRGTPTAVVEQIAKAARIAVQDPQLSKQLEEMGAQVVGSTQSEFKSFTEEEVKRWGSIVRASGASVD